MAEAAPPPDEEEDDPAEPRFEEAEFTDKVQLRLVPRDAPNSALIRDLAIAFTEAATQAGNYPALHEHVAVPDDAGVQLRAILDQKKEEIHQKAATAEPRATEFKTRIEESGPDANATEVEAARQRIFQAILELRQQGVVVTARAE